jgi:methylenetetrahydrofolate dehydrogenase (NADP+) / methenyltetrahydrofolate cyclohydrolase
MGIHSTIIRLPGACSQADLNDAIDRACLDPKIDGVLVQLPLPPELDEYAVMERINPMKDVDGFHPLNMGRMLARGVPPRFVPATALGCMELLERYGIDVKVCPWP